MVGCASRAIELTVVLYPFSSFSLLLLPPIPVSSFFFRTLAVCTDSPAAVYIVANISLMFSVGHDFIFRRDFSFCSKSGSRILRKSKVLIRILSLLQVNAFRRLFQYVSWSLCFCTFDSFFSRSLQYCSFNSSTLILLMSILYNLCVLTMVGLRLKVPVRRQQDYDQCHSQHCDIFKLFKPPP